MSSANFQMNSTLGQPSPLMSADDPPVSENYANYPGFWYTIDIEEISIILNLSEGWSMISLPVSPDIASVKALFPEAEVIYGYEKDIGYVRVQDEEELVLGRGYWILLKAEKSYELTGQRIQGYTLSVSKDGWYMIGGCTDQAKASIDNGTIGAIYGYVPGVGYQQVLETDNLLRGKGYWILFSDIIGLAQLGVEVENP